MRALIRRLRTDKDTQEWVILCAGMAAIAAIARMGWVAA